MVLMGTVTVVGDLALGFTWLGLGATGDGCLI